MRELLSSVGPDPKTWIKRTISVSDPGSKWMHWHVYFTDYLPNHCIYIPHKVLFIIKPSTNTKIINNGVVGWLQQCYCHHLEVDYLSKTACPGMFYSSYTATTETKQMQKRFIAFLNKCQNRPIVIFVLHCQRLAEARSRCQSRSRLESSLCMPFSPCLSCTLFPSMVTMSELSLGAFVWN